MNDKTLAREILTAAGVFENLLDELVENYSLDRIKEVVRYVVQKKHYRYPAPAIVKALQQGWEVSEIAVMDITRLTNLLEETNDVIPASENSI